jgi:predicted permease
MRMHDLVLLALCFALGLWAQRAVGADALRKRAWTSYFWTLTPVLVFYAFSTLTLDAELALAVAAAIVASWLVMALSYAYASLVSRDRQERGALALAGGFPNTGFVGYPLAQLALGNPGLALMVVYDRLAWLVPATAVSTTIARLHGRRSAASSARTRVRLLALNPPLLAAAAAVSLRLAEVDVAGAAEPLGRGAAEVVAPAGLFLLGLALPVERPSHDAAELRRAAGVLLIRFAIAPLVLLACGLALGATIPTAFYLAAAMPSAFHLLVLARVFDVRPQLLRLVVVGSTLPAVAVVAAGAALFR